MTGSAWTRWTLCFEAKASYKREGSRGGMVDNRSRMTGSAGTAMDVVLRGDSLLSREGVWGREGSRFARVPRLADS